MKRATYRALTVHADRWLAAEMPSPFVLGRDVLPRGIGAAIYIIENRQGEALYVGKTSRGDGRDAVVERLTEHMHQTDKAALWHRAYIIPLRSDTPGDVVEAIEGIIASDLGPSWSQTHPKRWLS